MSAAVGCGYGDWVRGRCIVLRARQKGPTFHFVAGECRGRKFRGMGQELKAVMGADSRLGPRRRGRER